MASYEDILNDKTTYPDDTKVTLASGVEVTLGTMRSGYLKDKDYRDKTSKLARERESMDRERSEWEAARLDAEQKLTNLAKQIFESRPDVHTKDELAEAMERDPVAKALMTRVDQLEQKLGQSAQAINAQQTALQQYAWSYMADQHRKVLDEIKKHDADLDAEDFIKFAQERRIPRLDDAYKVYRWEENLKKTEKDALERGRKEGSEKTKKELSQPVIPVTKKPSPAAQVAAKTFEEAKWEALQDPAILNTMFGEEQT